MTIVQKAGQIRLHQIFVTACLVKSIYAASVNSTCGFWNTENVLCINKYFNVLHGNFSRQISSDPSAEDTLASISAPSDPSLSRIANTTFLVFDSENAIDVLGSNPTFDLTFRTDAISHEGPVYVSDLNRLYVTQVSKGVLEQIYVDLNQTPPALSFALADPPIYAPTGSMYKNGLIYYSTTGLNATENGYVARPGIYTFDPHTRKSETLLNNYFGYFFNGVDDLDMEVNGDIWFTDDDYSYLDKTSDIPPSLPPSVYRFRPSSGVVQPVLTTLIAQPNGLRFSPSGQILYICDSGAASGPIDVAPADVHYTFSSRGGRALWAFDVAPSFPGSDSSTIVNGRVIYQAQDWVPDGLQMAKNRFLVVAAGKGVDVLSPEGVLLVRVQVPFLTQSAGFGRSGELWVVGGGAIARVGWALEG